MGQSYRIRTELGINKTINVQLDQEFEQLEILSLKLQQEDVYNRSCADYGVIVGRVTANNGFGLPNARVSIFIPISNLDVSNPIISSIYPYKSPNDANEDGYRYNLLPYMKSYSAHAATGTLPSRMDVLTETTTIEIYDKYYLLTSKTNESGDYMIMGVPIGFQTVVMDVDLSDIGEFSLTPQDLIRMGLATEGQVAGNRFKTSTDLNSLPQIINSVKQLDISPLWGEPDICDIAINRLDFDLRDDSNVDIQPTAVFMGSIYSTPDKFRVRKNARPKDNMGNLCSLQSGPGQILVIRQTIQQDDTGKPILEEFKLEQSGNIIDGDGVWLTELPMNLDYIITNEFGERVISNDPTLGIPTKSKYRFKIKWQQPPSLTDVKRPYFLVPNIKEYGWSNSSSDPNLATNYLDNEKLAGSYYFGLDWTGYTNTQAAINCEDTFYEFEFNRVYTVSGFIDQFKNGFRGRFIGIKEIDSQDCDSINKFPVNEGFRNFDLIYFLFSILLTILQPVGLAVLVAAHIVLYIVNLVYDFLCWLSGVGIGGVIDWYPFRSYSKYCKRETGTFNLPMITYPDCQACECDGASVVTTPTQSPLASPTSIFLTPISDPAQYYNILEPLVAPYYPVDSPYLTAVVTNITEAIATNRNPADKSALRFKNGRSDSRSITATQASIPFDTGPSFGSTGLGYSIQTTIPLGVRINIFNTNNKYYENVNRIKVTFAADSNLNYHYDNTLTVLVLPDFIDNLESGSILSFINPTGSTDTNFLWSGNTPTTTIEGIKGKLQTDEFVMNVDYADPNNRFNNLTTSYVIPKNKNIEDFCFDSVVVDVTYLDGGVGTIIYRDCSNNSHTIITTTLGPQTIYDDNCIRLEGFAGTAEYTIINSGDTCQRYTFASDLEYYQVLTAITISTTVINGVTNFIIPNASNSSGFLSELLTASNIQSYVSVTSSTEDGYEQWDEFSRIPGTLFEDFSNQKVVILQRGVDPYSPLLTNKYSVGRIFGQNIDDPNWTFTASTRVNIPVQKVPAGSTTTVAQHNNQNNIFFQSKFFTPGVIGSTTPGLQYSAFTTSNVGYYGALDNSNRFIYFNSNVNLTVQTSQVTDPISYSNILKGVVSQTDNLLYSATIGNNNFYDSAEDLSGGAISIRIPQPTAVAQMVWFGSVTLEQTVIQSNTLFNDLNFSPILYPTLTGINSLSITNPVKNIMRSERLPSSDILDNSKALGYSNSLLQQNLDFAVYVISGGGDLITGPVLSTGGSQSTPDIEGQLAAGNVLESLTDCERMVSLTCYSGNSVNFGIKSGCEGSDNITGGCYVFLKNPLTGLKDDIKSYSEWGFRFRFFYGLCRGVLAQSFTNNWVNGSLYMFPLQIDTYYDQENKPLPPDFAKQLAYFDGKTNNFYYRSSPYLSGTTSQRFIGRPTTGDRRPVNTRNLLFPTTIINLGIKDDFYQEIIFDPSAKAYIMGSLNPTSYSDTSDLVNLFVISRITDEGFLSQLFAFGNNGLNQLFTRDFNGGKRIDGDLAQSMSTNSEYGVIPFSPEFYSVYGTPDDPVVILGSLNAPTMGVFFSSTTFDLQNKDFLTPGVINFRPSNNANAITYPYGIKSQYVPFYQWKLEQPSTQSIFGSEKNNWLTTTTGDINTSGIFGYNYQSLSRRNLNTPSYFIGSNTQISDIYERGYIFNVNNTGLFSYNAGTYSDKFLVGAPFHFYFGINQGLTALDKFKTKYSISE